MANAFMGPTLRGCTRDAASNGICLRRAASSASKRSLKPERRPTPGRIHLRHAPVRQADARHADLEFALVLEEVQVAVALRQRVVHGMGALESGVLEARPLAEADAHGQLAPGLVEVQGIDKPGFGQAESSGEQLVVHGFHPCWQRSAVRRPQPLPARRQCVRRDRRVKGSLPWASTPHGSPATAVRTAYPE